MITEKQLADVVNERDAEISRLRKLVERGAACLEAGSDRSSRLHWASGLREDLVKK